MKTDRTCYKVARAKADAASVPVVRRPTGATSSDKTVRACYKSQMKKLADREAVQVKYHSGTEFHATLRHSAHPTGEVSVVAKDKDHAFRKLQSMYPGCEVTFK